MIPKRFLLLDGVLRLSANKVDCSDLDTEEFINWSFASASPSPPKYSYWLRLWRDYALKLGFYAMGCCWLGKGCKFMEWLTNLLFAAIDGTPSFSLMLLLLLGRRTGIRRSDSVGFLS